ncbi:MAG TPA: phytoene/squalene synthase family protein [Stellaceae bacterium]|nr:phytoene/squalene synthase family protein [Stellaceae bacterium]
MMLSSSLADALRRHDRDRYLSALFVPADRRGAAIALYVFNHEIAKTREVVTEPLLGQIRLQWWREAIGEAYAGGAIRPHEVMTPLAGAIREYRLGREHFEAMIDARELDLADEPPATLSALEHYGASTAGRLQRLVLEVLGVRDGEAVEAACEISIAYALVGLIRAIPFHARARRHYIPAEIAGDVGLEVGTVFELRPSPALARAVKRLAEPARQHLKKARSRRPDVPAIALPALLPARIAAGYLKDIAAVRGNVFDPRLAARASRTVLRLAWGAAIRRY